MISIVTLLVLSGSPRFVAAPMCHIDANQVFFHVDVPVQWKKKDGTQQTSNTIYQLKCFRKSRECTGAVLHSSNKVDGSGNPVIGIFDLETIIGATLQSLVGDVAVIQWGVHQFIFDAGAGTVTKTAQSGDGTPERGIGTCPKN